MPPFKNREQDTINEAELLAMNLGVPSLCLKKTQKQASKNSQSIPKKGQQHIQGIERLTLVLASICPPRSNKSFTMFVFPLLEATCSGVIPFYTMKRTNNEHDGFESV